MIINTAPRLSLYRHVTSIFTPLRFHLSAPQVSFSTASPYSFIISRGNIICQSVLDPVHILSGSVSPGQGPRPWCYAEVSP